MVYVKSEKIRSLSTFYSLPKRQQMTVMLLFAHMKQTDIAEKVKVAPQTISAWKSTEKFVRAQNEYNQYMLHDLVSEAILTMRDLLSARSEMVRYNAAQYIIDKASLDNLEIDDIQDEDDGFMEAINEAAKSAWSDNNEED